MNEIFHRTKWSRALESVNKNLEHNLVLNAAIGNFNLLKLLKKMEKCHLWHNMIPILSYIVGMVEEFLMGENATLTSVCYICKRFKTGQKITGKHIYDNFKGDYFLDVCLWEVFMRKVG